MTLEATELCKLIEQAFGSMPYPGDDNIVYDNSGYHLERAEIKQALKGLHWRDVSFDALDHLREALCFLSPQGFLLYLPDFLQDLPRNRARSSGGICVMFTATISHATSLRLP